MAIGATTVRPLGRPTITGTYDRIFYSGMSIAMGLTVFVGFAPTYYLRSFFGAPTTVTGAVTLTPLALLHAAVFTGWVLLFLVQALLVASHRVSLHRRLGIAGGVLAAMMVAVGVTTAIRAAARGSAPPGVDPLVFLAIPLGDMVVFPIFVASALWWRRDKEMHKRLMMMAYISILVAAVARMPGVLPLGPYGFFGLTFVFLLVAMLYDLLSRRYVHPAYVWGGVLLAASVPIRLIVSETAAWRAVAVFLIGS